MVWDLSHYFMYTLYGVEWCRQITDFKPLSMTWPTYDVYDTYEYPVFRFRRCWNKQLCNWVHVNAILLTLGLMLSPNTDKNATNTSLACIPHSTIHFVRLYDDNKLDGCWYDTAKNQAWRWLYHAGNIIKFSAYASPRHKSPHTRDAFVDAFEMTRIKSLMWCVRCKAFTCG